MQRCTSWQPAGGLLIQLPLLQAATLPVLVLVTQLACDPHRFTVQNSRGPSLLVWLLLPSAPTGIGLTAAASVQPHQQQQMMMWVVPGATHPTALAASQSSWLLQQ
jgi:hypothetical protein